jgi:hypothetical protein
MVMEFPTVTARDLAGGQVTLPAELPGEQRILLIAFQRRHETLIRSWTPFLQQLERANPNARAYELHSIRELPGVVQAFIDEGMRAGIADPAARERTLTLYLDKAAFREVLELPDEETIYVLFVDGEGEVRWRASGAYMPEGGRSLVEAIEKNGRGGP